MRKSKRNRAYRRDVEKRKYLSRIKENRYWLITDTESKLNGYRAESPKNWQSLISDCKFGKLFKNGGSPLKRDYWEKKYKKKQSERKHGYPEDKRVMDDDDIRMQLGELDSFCGACDHFNTEECPNFNNVDITTNWKEDINCERFYS